MKRKVTILILIDGFLQYRQEKINKEDKISHNPYFNRWFSAIAGYVEEQTRLRELKDFLNTPGMKKEVKYKVLEAQL